MDWSKCRLRRMLTGNDNVVYKVVNLEDTDTPWTIAKTNTGMWELSAGGGIGVMYFTTKKKAKLGACVFESARKEIRKMTG